MKKKMLAVMMTAVMAVGVLAGCGGNNSGDGADAGTDAETGAETDTSADENGTGTYVYEKTVLNADEVEIPAYSFGRGSLEKQMRALRVELTLAEDDTFTMDVHGWMQEDTEGSDIAVGEAFEYGNGMYAEYFSSASGTYEKDGDEVTVTVDEASYEIPDLGVSYLAQIFTKSNAAGGSYNPEGDVYYGEWTSADTPALLEQFPETVFTLDGDTIVTWEKAGRLTQAEGEKAGIVFYNDGTAYYEDTENGMSADMAWSFEGENVVLTYSGAEGEGSTATGNASTPLEITLRQYTDATSYTDFTQSIALTEENLSALQ